MPSKSAGLVNVTSVVGMTADDVIAVSDCSDADIMQITQVNASSLDYSTTGGTPGNASNSLDKAYGTDAEILRFVARRYFIGNGAAGPALFRQQNLEIAAIELIEGVENMQILYGEDTAGNDAIADTYVDADTVANWSDVVSMRLALLFRTINDNRSNDANNTTYDLLGTDIGIATTITHTADNRRRRVVNATVQIRNRSNK